MTKPSLMRVTINLLSWLGIIALVFGAFMELWLIVAIGMVTLAVTGYLFRVWVTERQVVRRSR
jgi:hypothetical protein